MKTIERGVRNSAPNQHGVTGADEIKAHLMALDFISRAELPDGLARSALVAAIWEGAISGIFPASGAGQSLIALAWARPSLQHSAYRTLAQVNEVWALIARWQTAVCNAHALWLLFLDGHIPGEYFDGAAGKWRGRVAAVALA